MYAKKLEHMLYLLCAQSDISHFPPQELEERFTSLRGSALLPRGRERRAVQLSDAQIASAVLALVPLRSGWAGLGAIILNDLRPVGGPTASFFGAETLSAAVQRLLADKTARETVIRLTVSVAETATNSHGGATLVCEAAGSRRYIYFVPKLAISLTAPGRDADFDPEKHQRHAAVARELTFTHRFFRDLAQRIEISRASPLPPEGDDSEYEGEEAREERRRRLGVRPGSRFVHVGVDNQVTWPQDEKLIRFDGYTLVLLPKTKDHVQSVHMDLVTNHVEHRDALTIINRFLSIMTWCDDSFAIAEGGRAGNPEPVPVPRRDLAFMTSTYYLFDRKIPVSEDAKRALALYREARNAEQNGFVALAVLDYYKIIEIRNHHKETVRKWFQDNFGILQQDKSAAEEVKRFLVLCGSVAPAKYIHDSCRIAVAHAGKNSKSDPDDAHELIRLHTAAGVMHLLARHFIKDELVVSDSIYSGD